MKWEGTVFYLECGLRVCFKVQFLMPLEGQKPMAVKTVPQKPPLYKTFERITGPVF